MAQTGGLTQESFSCSICLDPLKDPVTIPCGHSYCMNCITTCWDGEDGRRRYSCPQCRQRFTLRPVLVKNTMLAELMEQLKKPGLQAAAADHCYAGTEDVVCDVCTGRKLKAVRSCLTCLVSYCETHIQPHYDSAAFGQHKLVEASHKLQDNVCSRHHRAKELFCRTDQQCICHLCCADEHRGHDTVSAAAERSERQRELEGSRQKIQQRIQDREKDVKVLQWEVEAIGRSADQTVEKSEKIFTELIRVMEERRREVKQQIRSQQQTDVGRVQEVEEKLQQELTELKRRDAELEQLSHTEDHVQFLHLYPSLAAPGGSTDSPRTNICTLRYFEDVTAAVSELRDQLQDIVRKMWTNISLIPAVKRPLQSLSKRRTEFLKCSCDITLDPNTVNTWLLLSGGNRKVTFIKEQQSYSPHPARFTDFFQVLSRERLTGRCYWEVEWTGAGPVIIAVAYKNIGRVGFGKECKFGCNDRSWSLICNNTSYKYRYNNIDSTVSGRLSSRIGVYLDHTSGLLSFYSVSKTTTLLHRVQTTFTQPLYAGLWVNDKSTAEICNVK